METGFQGNPVFYCKHSPKGTGQSLVTTSPGGSSIATGKRARSLGNPGATSGPRRQLKGCRDGDLRGCCSPSSVFPACWPVRGRAASWCGQMAPISGARGSVSINLPHRLRLLPMGRGQGGAAPSSHSPFSRAGQEGSGLAHRAGGLGRPKEGEWKNNRPGQGYEGASQGPKHPTG